MKGKSIGRSVDEPTPTCTTRPNLYVAEPFIIPQFSENAPKEVEQPLGTITTTSRGIGLAQPFLLPFFGEREGQAPRTHSVDVPLPTVTGQGAGAVVEPYLVSVNHGDGDNRRVKSIHDPMPTVTTKQGVGIAQPFILPLEHSKSGNTGDLIDKPMRTITTADAFGLARPVLVKFNRTGDGSDIEHPLPTVTTKDRFGLVEPEAADYYLDIRFRMLKPHELAAAMGFPKEYIFTGSRDRQVKQIGNAVPVNLAEALCYSLISDYMKGEAKPCSQKKSRRKMALHYSNGAPLEGFSFLAESVV